MIRTQKFELICGCIIHEKYDDSIEYNPEMTGISKLCDMHQDCKLDDSSYQRIKSDNQIRNKIDNYLVENFPIEKKIKEDGKIKKEFTSPNFDWFVSKDGNVTVSVDSFDVAKKEFLKKYLESLGIKVKIN